MSGTDRLYDCLQAADATGANYMIIPKWAYDFLHDYYPSRSSHVRRDQRNERVRLKRLRKARARPRP